jgi:outer membrane protein assembly factor BamB
VPFRGKEPTHATNPYCSATPACDGERVVASHGSAGLVCYDLLGKQLWQRDLGPFEHIWGTAASPVLYRDLVILNCGPGERTFLLAVDKRTGKDVWKVEEPGGASGAAGSKEWVGSWATPRVVTAGGRDELVMAWPGAVKAYEPLTGKVLWECQGLGKLVYTSPVVAGDVVVALSGYHGPGLAVRAGGSGDVTKTHRLWHQAAKNPQRIGSAVVAGGLLYHVNAGPGTVQCLDPKTGEDRWGGRRLGSAFWASPVLADGRVYATDQSGDTYVFAADPQFKQLARNRLGEHTDASPAVSDGQVFLRTHKHLWCIASAE